MSIERNDRTSRGVAQDTFECAITQPERAEKVAEYMVGRGGSHRVIKDIASDVKFGVMPTPATINAVNPGFLFYDPDAAEYDKEIPVVTDLSLPSFLVQQTGLDRSKATDVAANQAYTFGLIVGGIAMHRKMAWRTTLRGAVTEGMNEAVWPEAFIGSSNAQSVPYRVASEVALSLSGVDTSFIKNSFSGLPEKITLDPHLAGLVNPAPTTQVSVAAQTYLR